VPAIKQTSPCFRGLHPIFTDVADPDCVRYDLSTPWRQDGYVYATDGRLLVRCPIDDVAPGYVNLIPAREDSESWKRPADPGDQFAIHGPHRDTPIVLPEIPCPRLPCQDCGGFGGFIYSYGPPWEFWPCEGCGAIGTVLNTNPVTLGRGDTEGSDYNVAAWIVALLGQHRALVYLPVDLDSPNRSLRSGALRFEIGRSIEGLAMPLGREGGASC
jgi:hypothetical protein